MERDLENIVRSPTIIHNNHESLYRSYHILRYVLKMVERGDSKETILELTEFLQSIDGIKFLGKNN